MRFPEGGIGRIPGNTSERRARSGAAGSDRGECAED
jgi:hypothetical protein